MTIFYLSLVLYLLLAILRLLALRVRIVLIIQSLIIVNLIFLTGHSYYVLLPGFYIFISFFVIREIVRILEIIDYPNLYYPRVYRAEIENELGQKQYAWGTPTNAMSKLVNKFKLKGDSFKITFYRWGNKKTFQTDYIREEDLQEQFFWHIDRASNIESVERNGITSGPIKQNLPD